MSVTTDNTINVNLGKPKGMASFHPRVKIESISLHSGVDIVNTKQDPHIVHPDEISVYSASNIALAEAFMPMEVSIDAFILLPIENNTYLNVLFDKELTSYLKIGFSLCMNKQLHDNISSNVYSYLNPLDGLIRNGNTDTIKKYTMMDAVGLENLLPNNINKALEKENGAQDFVDIGIQTNLPYEKVTEKNGKTYYKIPFNKKMTVPATAGGINTDFLSLFVFTHFDIHQLKDSLDMGGTGYKVDININDSLKKNLTLGTIDSDIIISNGMLNDKTYAYKYASTIPSGLSQIEIAAISSVMSQKAGQWYWGPAHQMPNGTWMTGASHNAYNSYGSQTLSLPLEKINIPNAKVKDYRQKAELESFNFDLNQTSQYFTNDEAILKLANNGNELTKLLFSKKKPSYFSEFYCSRDVYGANRFLFNFNVHHALLDNSMFGDLLTRLALQDKDKYLGILKEAKITSFKLMRKKTKKSQVIQSDVIRTTFSKQDFSEMIVYSNDGDTGILQQLAYNPVQDQGIEKNYTSQTLATIAELNLVSNDSPGIRTFSGVDFSIANKLSGVYQYSLEIEMADPSISYLISINNSLKKILEGGDDIIGFSEYINDMSNPSYSDPISNRFTLKAFKYFLQKYPQNFIPVAVKQYIDLLYELGIKTTTDVNDQRLKHFNFLCSISSANTGSIDGALLFYNLVNGLVQKLDKLIASSVGYVKLKAESVSSASDPHTTLPENNPNIIANTKPRTFKISHVFKKTFNAEVPFGYGMDFLSNSVSENANSNSFIPNGLKMFTLLDLRKRFNLETEKLLNVSGDGSISTQVGYGRNNESQGIILNPNDTSNGSKFSFLSPSIINLPKQQPFFSLGESRNNNPEKYAETFLDMYGSTLTSVNAFDIGKQGYQPQGNTAATQLDFLDLSNTEKEKRYDLNRIFAEKGCTLEVKSPPPLDVSPFNVLSGFFDANNNIDNDDLVTGNFDQYILDTNININKMLSMLLYIDDFRLLPKIVGRIEEKNSINSIDFYNPVFTTGGKTFKDEAFAYGLLAGLGGGTGGDGQVPDEAPLNAAPNHIKALLLNTTNNFAVRDNIVKTFVEKSLDPFKDVNAFPFIQINYKTLNTIEVFRGFKLGNVQDPEFTKMTESDLNPQGTRGIMLCRQKRYYNPAYGVVKSKYMDLPTFDEYFFVSQQEVQTLEDITQPPPRDLSPAKNPLIDAVDTRSRFFESSGPDLVLPEYMQSGLLEMPKLDDGLSDPIMKKSQTDNVKKNALSRTVGENMQMLKDMGLGYLLGGNDMMAKTSNATARRGGVPIQKSKVMKGGIAEQLDQSAPVGSQQASNNMPKTPESPTPDVSYQTGGGTY